jgi:hypothetical protein
MYLLYVDESGSASDDRQSHFVLAGLCIFERQGYWIAEKLDGIAARFDPAEPAKVELHGSPMFKGRKFWRSFCPTARCQAIKDALQVIQQSHPSNRLFASVVRKSLVSPRDVVEVAFEQVVSRFDHYLARLHKKKQNTQRGIIISDQSTYEATIQSLATDFRTVGHTWGVLRNLAEVPLFLDSRASRLVQLADLVAYALFQHFEHNDPQFFDLIQSRFDTEGGIRHGLHTLL